MIDKNSIKGTLRFSFGGIWFQINNELNFISFHNELYFSHWDNFYKNVYIDEFNESFIRYYKNGERINK